MFPRRSIVLALPGIALLGAAGRALAETYPARPVRFIVPVAPGSATDLTARQVSAGLFKLWNSVPVVVENKPGAGTIIGTDAVAKAPADGYTLLFNLSSHYTSPVLNKTSYDPVKDFEPVAKLVSTALVMITSVDSPFKTVQDVVAAAKKAPGTVTFASAGNGTTSHMGGALLNNVAGIELVHAPYKDGSQAMVDTSTGQVKLGFSGPAAIPLIKSGKLRVLATTGATRSAHLPDVPTVKEALHLDYEVTSPVWAFAPKGTPEAIVNQLSEAFGKIVATPEFKTFCDNQFLDLAYEPAATVRAAAAGEAAKWRKLVDLTRS
ncbi:Bug family tripartite tricarboxylate transporter substrate binding protein [Pseudorhodoferax sp.]|uniref:Bug family tripartite tricarboxylate transporter substrate binding protein n=1 Tax=Pseudorhodoferax sp. TaxID=1993553 RepID=UPI0039E2FA87